MRCDALRLGVHVPARDTRSMDTRSMDTRSMHTRSMYTRSMYLTIQHIGRHGAAPSHLRFAILDLLEARDTCAPGWRVQAVHRA